MRPYLAIIKDSFRAVMASRVLYVLLFLIAVLLIFLAPLHMRETLDWKLIMEENVRRPELVARRLAERFDEPDQQAIARIWSQFPEDLREKLLELVDETEKNGDENLTKNASPETRGVKVEVGQGRRPSHVEEIFTFQEMIEELNNQIEDPEFYREQDWKDRVLPEEADELIKDGVDSLSDVRSKRLNRILISQALAPGIGKGNTALEFWYAYWQWEFLTTSFTHQQFAQTLTTQLPYYFDKFVLSIGLFIAILVTANMIPETFEPGSLNLLLSKPISRWGLFIAKFIGGCVFIFLCAAFLFLGIWLWLGLAMEVWDRAILYSIPLYVVVFAVYFSVSALVGLVWRSAIVAVILTLLFWATCFAAGSVHGIFATKMGNSEIVDLLGVEDNVYSVDVLHQIEQWDEKKNEWDMALEADMGEGAKLQFGINSYMIPMRNLPAMPGIGERIHPVYDAAHSQIFASPYVFGQFLASSKKKMYVSDSNKIKFREVGEFPRDTLEIMLSSNGLLAINGDGEFFRLNRESLEAAQAKKSLKPTDDNVTNDDELNEAEEDDSNQDLFDPVGPNQRVSIRSPGLVSMNPANDQIAIYRRDKITLFAADQDGQYNEQASLEVDIDFDTGMSCLLEYKGQTIVLVYGNGKVITIDASSLEELNEYQPESRSAIDGIAGSEDGRFFAIRYRNGNLWLLDMDAPDKIKKADVIGQGDVCGFAFGDDDKLWVADNTDRATLYHLASGERGERYSPGGTWLEKVFRYGISPIYKVFPKPGEFYKVVTHLSSSGDTADNESVDLRKYPLENTNPWSPLFSGLCFMAVMLFLACVIFQFKDF